jgi:hypothetical protein
MSALDTPPLPGANKARLNSSATRLSCYPQDPWLCVTRSLWLCPFGDHLIVSDAIASFEKLPDEMLLTHKNQKSAHLRPKMSALDIPPLPGANKARLNSSATRLSCYPQDPWLCVTRSLWLCPFGDHLIVSDAIASFEKLPDEMLLTHKNQKSAHLRPKMSALDIPPLPGANKARLNSSATRLSCYPQDPWLCVTRSLWLCHFGDRYICN